MTAIALTRVTDFAALGERWRALEAQADGTFFKSWTWTGCLAEERFPDPVLLDARQDGETVALALFNRRRFLRQTLLLGETGDGIRDTPFIEYNGVLAMQRALPALCGCLTAAREAPVGSTGRPWLPRRLVLSGVGDAMLEAARGAGPVTIQRSAQALDRPRTPARDRRRFPARTEYQYPLSDTPFGPRLCGARAIGGAARGNRGRSA